MGPLSSRRAGSLPTAQATAAQLRRELETLGDPAIAAHSRRFFKTGKGEYGEGDRFLGIRVPVLRRQARRYAAMSLRETRLGAHLDARSKRPLYDLARSASLWERRIAIMATLHFIKQDRFAEALRVSRQLLADPHDLIHKAVGWMLREIGKRDIAVERDFLRKHYRGMPRTMLRYAIERFPQRERQRYLAGTI